MAATKLQVWFPRLSQSLAAEGFTVGGGPIILEIAELNNHHEGGGFAFTGLHGDTVSMAMRPKVTPCASFFFFFFF
jgi:hypothetical protein